LERELDISDRFARREFPGENDVIYKLSEFSCIIRGAIEVWDRFDRQSSGYGKIFGYDKSLVADEIILREDKIVRCSQGSLHDKDLDIGILDRLFEEILEISDEFGLLEKKWIGMLPLIGRIEEISLEKYPSYRQCHQNDQIAKYKNKKSAVVFDDSAIFFFVHCL
jgi:hypothetical protein